MSDSSRSRGQPTRATRPPSCGSGAATGLHQVAELHQSFGLGAVEPELSVELRVAQEPGAPVVGAAALLILAGVVLARAEG